MPLQLARCLEGLDDHHTYRYGVELWRQRVANPQRLTRVRPID